MFLESATVGVGSRHTVFSGMYLGGPGFCPPAFRPYVDAVGVGSKDPESLASVWQTDVVRSQHTPLRIEPELGQSSEHNSEVAPNKSGHVLQEHDSRSYLPNDSECLGPEVALVVGSTGMSGQREWLAGEVSTDGINDAIERPSVEGADVVPDREGWEEPLLLSSKEDLSAVRITLHRCNDRVTKQP